MKHSVAFAVTVTESPLRYTPAPVTVPPPRGITESVSTNGFLKQEVRRVRIHSRKITTRTLRIQIPSTGGRFQ
jgi:hypothetical protein